MVTNVTSLTGNGLKDWLIQRLTAVYFLLYVLFILGFILAHPNMAFATWRALFNCHVMQIATVLAFLAFLIHTWIGIWTVTTDYLRCTYIRLTLQILIALLLMGQFIWGLLIIWGK